MIDRLEKSKCCGCGACVSACPTDAVVMKEDREGYLYPRVDAEVCVQCQICEKVCPAVKRRSKRDSLLKAYACYYQEEGIRARSTSGGIFSAIAEYLLEEKKGKVYGVCFNDNFMTEYSSADNKNELGKFRGSKYSQCSGNNVYQDVKKELARSRTVLFSGLPCQIEGLRSYLGRDYESLYLLDMVCFGIGSPGLWRSYRTEFHPHAEEICFKDKSEGWKNWKVFIRENGEDHYYSRYDNLYMKSYLERINLRPSCYECQFKGLQRNSDFTIADCWGMGEKSILNDNKGLSALLLHTDKAADLFEQIKNKLLFEEYDPELLMAGNWAVYRNAEKSIEREKFFEQIYQGDFKENYRRLMGSMKE